MAHVTVDGLDVHYDEHGPPDGEPLVLLHGAGGTADDAQAGWAGLIPSFAAHFRVLAVEHRGHGRTGNPDGFQTFEQLGDDVAGFVAALGIAPVHIAGISDGGVMALDCAIRRPEVIRTITLVGSNYCVDATTLAMADGLDADAVEQRAPEVAARFAARHDPGRYAGYWKDLIRQVADNNAVNPTWTEDDLRRVACPVLLVAGENDPFANIDQMVTMKRTIPGAEWLVVNHAGHAVHWEQPEVVGPRILDFLLRHSADGTAGSQG
jgi:pimeloyl-ACP methyl ester carboxylesterase